MRQPTERKLYLTLNQVSFLWKPMISIGAKAKPAFGTRRASIPLGLPAKRISTSGWRALMKLATAIAGLM